MDTQDTSKDDWESQLTDYTFGVMDPETASRFEQRLLECREHVALAQEYSGVAAWLALAEPPAEPPQGHKTRLMSRIGTLPQAQDSSIIYSGGATSGGATINSVQPTLPQTQGRELTGAPAAQAVDLGSYREKRRLSMLFPALSAVAAALVLFVGVWGWQSVQEAQSKLNEAQSRLNEAQSRLNIPPGYTAFSVEGQGETTASAVAFVNPDTNEAALLANGLTPLPADKVYELWLLPAAPDGKPVPAGVFNARNDGQARHDVVPASRIEDHVGVAVTIEDAPGVQETQQQPIMAGKYATP
ncbi:MAG: anti-sigma factor [Chloroflexia bacterium]